MSHSEEVDQLLRELKDLQIRQTKILERIQSAEQRRRTQNTAEFAPGDKVVITNRTSPPGGAKPSAQDKTGVVVSVTAKRVQIRTDSGVNTSRAPNNLRKAAL